VLFLTVGIVRAVLRISFGEDTPWKEEEKKNEKKEVDKMSQYCCVFAI